MGKQKVEGSGTVKHLVVNRLQSIGGKPREGYMLNAKTREPDKDFEIYEIYLPPDKLQVMAMEFLTGNIPWDWDLPIKR